MTSKHVLPFALLVALTGVAHAQADLLAPLHGPMTALVRTPEDADAVCTSVLVAQAVEKTIERASKSSKTALKEDEAMSQLSADPAWASRTVPTIHRICRCAMGRMANGGSDLLGRMTVDDSAQAFVRALQQPDIRDFCVASAQQPAGSK